MRNFARARAFARMVPVGTVALGLLLAVTACGGSIPEPRTGRDALQALENGTRPHPTLDSPVGYVRSAATAEPATRHVLYVHGTPGEKEAWADFLATPVQGTASLAIDRPGFGLSAASGPVPGLLLQAEALEPFLPAAGEPGAVLVGHSLGGPIVAAAAIRYPDRIAAVVIVAGSLDPDLESTMMVQHLANAGIVRWMLPDWLDVTNQELLPLKAELEALRARLPELRQPVVILHGTEDDLVPYANVAFMERWLGGARRIESITLVGADHFLPWNAEGEVRAAIVKALRMAEGG